MEDKPSIDFTGANDFQAYGSCLPDPMIGDLLLFHFPSMTDPEVVWEESQGWTVWSVGLAGSYEDFKCIDMCGFPHGEDIAPTPDFHGMITYSCVDVGTGQDTFGFIYETDDGGLSIIYMEDVEGDIGNVASDIDLSNGEFIFAIEWENEPDLIEDGVFLDLQYLEPGNDYWWQTPWTENTFEGAHNPDVAADGGNCYLVYEMINPTFGYTDIYCAHSTDNFQTYQIDRVTQTDLEDDYYPSVTAIGQTVTCSYIRDGDLYTATSEDGGVTWEESEPINDVSGSVSEQLYSADMAGGRYIVWTTDIESTKGINFDTLELDIAIPEIEHVSGGIGVSASIKNVGTVTATEIPWSIDIDGPVLIGSHNEGVITNLAAGDSETIRIPLVLGLGTVSITVNAGGVQKQEEGKVILFFITGL
jgi:hypothetical protein